MYDVVFQVYSKVSQFYVCVFVYAPYLIHTHTDIIFFSDSFSL